MDSGPPTFDEWLKRARPRLLRLAQSRLRDRGEAEDAVQDTALAVWKRHAKGGIQDLDAYANRAVWQNSIRRSVRRPRWESLEEAEAASADDASDRALDAWFDAGELEAAIAGLPQAQQAVIRLRFYTGLSFKEMGEALSIGLNTAASRTRYALQALKLALGPASERAAGRGPIKEVEHGTRRRTRNVQGKPARPALRKRHGGGGRGD
jgi:RNA polymerase sigma-70 factor (ECF subfamily)